MKRCYKCDITKSRREFHRDRSRKDGLHNRCKDCKRESNARSNAARDRTTGPGQGRDRTPEYVSWVSAKQRVTNPNRHDWSHYGGRGISMDPRWLESFDAFLADLGPRPEGTSIDRIDPNGHYEPGNVRWADALTQARNKRSAVSYGGA